MMRHLSVTIALVCAGLMLVACQLPARPSVVNGVLHGELVWSGEVTVAGDVVLTEDASLTVLPGTTVRFMPAGFGNDSLTEHPHFPGSELIVKGRLHAIGTANRPIVFQGAEPDAVAGSWGAINLVGSPEAVFEYCIFRQADSAIHSRESAVYIEQCLFEDNLVGVRFHSSDILVENNLFRGNQAAVRFHFGAPVICNNTFEDNRINLFITSFPRDYHIEYNRFGPAVEYQVVLGEQVPEDVLLPRNYWAVSDTHQLAEQFYDGRRSSYLGKVKVAPILIAPPKHNGFSWNP